MYFISTVLVNSEYSSDIPVNIYISTIEICIQNYLQCVVIPNFEAFLSSPGMFYSLKCTSVVIS